MKLKTKTAFAVAGIIIAFYLINVSIMTYLIYKTNQDYFTNLLSERESSLKEMIADEFSEIETYLVLFESLSNSKVGYSELKEAVYNNYHIDAFLKIGESGTEFILSNNIDRGELVTLSEVLKSKGLKNRECGFEKVGELYMICAGVNPNDGAIYALIDKVDEEFFEETKPLLGLDTFYFSEKYPEVNTPLIGVVPAERIGGGVAGYFVVGFSGSLTPAVVENVEIGVVVFTISAFFLSVLGYYLFQNDVLKRIYKIRDYMLGIKEEGFSAKEKLEIEGDDEIQELAMSINSALQELENSRNNLQRALENLKVINRVLRHDLLNDLTAIRGYCEIGSEECKFCEKVVERADKAVRIIKLLRDVEGIIRLSDLEKFRLSEVIKDVMDNYEIEYEISGDGEVLADCGIYSVFDNLVNNSIKHGKSTRISFEILDEGDYVHVIMKDYGTGISEDSIDKIFDEGFSHSGSTGIGLYIVKKFMEKYGGRVKAESSENEGAVFHLFFRKFTGDSQVQETSSSE